MTLAGIVMLLSGSNAVIWSEFIQSNKGCIETPKTKPTHAFEEIMVIKVAF